MSIVKLNTGFNIEVSFNISPFHKRVIALLIDLAVLFVYMLMINYFRSSTGLSSEWLLILLYLPALCYHLLCEITFNGQSIGKKAMGLQVITMEGGQPSISQYLLRWMFKPIDFPYWILFAISMDAWQWYTIFFIFSGLACVILTERSQRIGDLVAGTLIIDKKQNTSWRDTLFTVIEDNYVPMFPAVMKLSDRDMNTIKRVLKTRGSSDEYKFRITEKIKSALQVKTDLEPDEFMEILLKDYNHLSSL